MSQTQGEDVIIDIPGDGTSPSPDSVAILHEEFDLLPQRAWIQEMRGALMVLATMIASLTYASGMTPMGGFWQDDVSGPDGHQAGNPIMFSKYPTSYIIFRVANSLSFFSSVLLIVLVSSDYFYRTRAQMTFVLLITILDFLGLLCSYTVGTRPESILDGVAYFVATIIIFLLMAFGVYSGRAIWKRRKRG